jgi:hypothetical protein
LRRGRLGVGLGLGSAGAELTDGEDRKTHEGGQEDDLLHASYRIGTRRSKSPGAAFG